ncbi:MAG: type I restriction endonuclease subunit R [Paraclostridium sp.]
MTMKKINKEYIETEKPLLQQLANLGWEIIEHEGIPQCPRISRRNSFREIIIKDDFIKNINQLNPWMTERQMDDLYREFCKKGKDNFLENNKEKHEYLLGKVVFRYDDENTGEKNKKVILLSDIPQNNSFLAVSQFRVDTPGCAKIFIIPDIVLFINGIPVVVIECKVSTETSSEPMEEGINQLLRYQNRRLNSMGDRGKEGAEELFYFNQFVISTYGEESRIGTISSDYEHFLEWKTAYPLEKENVKSFYHDKIRSQEVMVQGVLEPSNLIKIIKYFIIFNPTVDGKEIKIICRYQQFRAVQKIINRMLDTENPKERSGVVWHTQGSGKSLTMVFLIRQIRDNSNLKDYKILLVNDRTDLEEQLGQTANLSDETPNFVESMTGLEILRGNASDLNLVMMHKFGKKDKMDNEKIEKLIEAGLLYEEDLLPEYQDYSVINESDRILILIDEAHRTQNNPFGLAGNLFNAFPNSTKIAFTGTPLIGEKQKKTIETFGGGQDYIDTYKARDAVNDGATLQIVYEGRYNELKIKNEEEFERGYEEAFKNKTEKEKQEILKKGSQWINFFESPAHIEEVSKNLVNHYVDEILENGFKAQVVCVSKLATVRYKNFIDKAIKERIILEEVKESKNKILIEKLKFLKSAIVISEGVNDPSDMVEFSKESKRLDAIKSFKSKFDYENENTGIAFLIVCNKLLTGFDAPIEQVMYLDKRMKEHNLFQALTRVNRTYKQKSKGYVVDYAANAQQVNEALNMYSGDNEKKQEFKAIESPEDEKGILEDRYYRIINFFKEKKISEIEAYLTYSIENGIKQNEVFEKIMDILEDEIDRTQFQTFVKQYLFSLDIVINKNINKKYKQSMYSLTHLLERARHRFKDETINLLGVGDKIKNLVDSHVESYGIGLRIKPVELFDSDFEKQLKEARGIKARASEMEHAIRKHISVNRGIDPVLFDDFFKKLEAAIVKYNIEIEARYYALEELFEEMKTGRKKEGDLEEEYQIFYDLISSILYDEEEYPENKRDDLISIVIAIVEKLKSEIGKTEFWNTPSHIKELESSILSILLAPRDRNIFIKRDLIISEVINLAKKRHVFLVK